MISIRTLTGLLPDCRRASRRRKGLGNRTYRGHYCYCITVVILFMIGQLPSYAQPSRPLIIVPGIIGSVLSEGDDVVWGNAGSLNSSNFRKLDLLPNASGASDLHPAGVIRDVPLVFGLIRVGVYSTLIDFLEEKMGYKEGRDLFVFSYDWRRTNFSTAKRLSAFIERHVKDEEYDLIAHSMGGIVTRIMLAGGASGGICETGRSTHPELIAMTPADLNILCDVMYGPDREAGEAVDQWPSTFFAGPYKVAANLKTYVEVAVPHEGSNSLVATFLEGWGALTRILTGTQSGIQNVILSMAAPIELAPVYEKCCAKGRAGAVGNRALATIDERLDFDWWSKKILGFGLDRCPYQRCPLRRSLLAASLESRKSIDAIVKNEIPESVEQLIVFAGADVEDTHIVHYVERDSPGNGKGVSFQTSRFGDGTVPLVSAKAPEPLPSERGMWITVGRTQHPFIFESETITDQLQFAILNPTAALGIQVAGPVTLLANQPIRSSAVSLHPQIVLPGEDIELRVAVVSAGEFEQSALASETLEARLKDASANQVISSFALTVEKGVVAGEALISGGFPAPMTTGVFSIEIAKTGEEEDFIDETLLTVIEKE